MKRWYVAYTTANGERLAKEDLEALGFRAFLPMQRVWHRPARHRRDRRRKLVERPLFPRYLFVQLGHLWHDFDAALASKRVLALLTDAYQRPVAVPDSVVDGMLGEIERGRFDAAIEHARRLVALVGRDVELADGPFKGLFATVAGVTRNKVRLEVKAQNGNTLSLALPLQGFESSVNVPASDDQHKQRPARRARLIRGS